MVSRFTAAGAVIKKLSRALIFFFVLTVGIPVMIGALFGISQAGILSLVISTLILQAAAPPIGLALGLSTPAILVVMACFAIGMVAALMELCDSLALSSERVRDWIDRVGKKMENYPAIRRYGAVSCIAIAWVPGIGLYGTPIIAWILGWKRIPAILFTTLGFVIASVFVLFFASRLSIELILWLVVIAVAAGIVLLVARKFTRKKKDR
ncbi:MAG: hypothetical protein LUQ01_06075 [Methanolinea sp.]|nr:hypothetical protein [Methanolinea sp.]